MDIAKALRDENERKNRLVERALVARAIADKLEQSLAPRGTYKIPKLLDERRFEYGIPNGCFEHFPLFDKVYIWQLNMTERTTYTEGGVIQKPEARIAHDRKTAPRGIIVAAGLAALDSLRSAGADIGHIVRFKKYAPFMQEVCDIDGHVLEVVTLRDGDMVASEDLAQEFHQGIVRVVNVASEKGSYDHRFERTLDDGTVVTTGQKVAAYYDPSS
jgi:hypothetical protein